MYAYTVNIELVALLKMKFLIMILASKNIKQIFSLVILYIAFVCGGSVQIIVCRSGLAMATHMIYII